MRIAAKFAKLPDLQQRCVTHGVSARVILALQAYLSPVSMADGGCGTA